MRAPSHRPGRRAPLWRSALLLLVSLLAVAGCGDAGGVIVGPGGGRGYALHSGAYVYRAWSDYSSRNVAWWGYLDIRVGADGQISGTYELPRQCTDAYGYEATCYGRVGGRLYSDGSIRFGLDEGWLSHQGSTVGRSEVTGRWQSRILGYRDSGTFELIPY